MDSQDVTQIYLTRRQVAEIYPVSEHTLASLASRGLGPIFFKPIDKALYRAQDIEAWIEAAVVTPVVRTASSVAQPLRSRTARGRGKAIPKSQPLDRPPLNPNGRKSLPPSPNSSLRRSEQARARQGVSGDV